MATRNILLTFLLAISLNLPFFSPIGKNIEESLKGIDKTPFAEAIELTYKNNQCTQTFDYEKDAYNLVKYTAKYSRVVYFDLYLTNECQATIDVFIESRHIASYSSGLGPIDENTFFLFQGETIYYRIKCNGSCTWVGTLMLDANVSGFDCVNYQRFHDYNLPHLGTATIYYSYKENVFNEIYDEITGLKFRYIDLINEAISLWESCGDIDFVFDDYKASFKIDINALKCKDVKVEYSYNTFSNNMDVKKCLISNDRQLYLDMSNLYRKKDGSKPSFREDALGLTVAAFGHILGLNKRLEGNSTFNMMSYPYKPFAGGLGDSDLNSFMILWGDANIFC